MMLVYDSMRVRDDLRETDDNVFWVREVDAIEIERQRDISVSALKKILYEGPRAGTKEYVESRKNARAALEEINNG